MTTAESIILLNNEVTSKQRSSLSEGNSRKRGRRKGGEARRDAETQVFWA